MFRARHMTSKWKRKRVLTEAVVEPPKTSTDSLEEVVGAYGDEPLADEEWMEKYQEEVQAFEELEQRLKTRLSGTTPVSEW